MKLVVDISQVKKLFKTYLNILEIVSDYELLKKLLIVSTDYFFCDLEILKSNFTRLKVHTNFLSNFYHENLIVQILATVLHFM